MDSDFFNHVRDGELFSTIGYTHLFGNARKDVVATSSNKEKSFFEIVVGIGDKNNTAVGSAEGELAAQI